jgi:hypothetical protein
MSGFSTEPLRPDLLEPVVRAACLGGLALWSLLAARSPRFWRGLLPGLLVFLMVHGAWTQALPRPYGFLVDPAVTKEMSTAAVVSSTGQPLETCLARESNSNALRDRLFTSVVRRPELTVAFFRWTPVLATPLLALGLYLGGPSKTAWLSAVMTLLFWPVAPQLLSTPRHLAPFSFYGDPWGAVGFLLLVFGLKSLPEGPMTARPVGAALLLLSAFLVEPALGTTALGFVAGEVAVTRWRKVKTGAAPGVMAVLLGTGLSFLLALRMGWLSLEPSAMQASSRELAIWATLGQALWLALAFAGLRRPRSFLGPLGPRLLAAGLVLLLLRILGIEGVPAGHSMALYRLGLLLCAVPAIFRMASFLEQELGWPARAFPARAAQALALFVAGALSPLYQWSPHRGDHHFRLSEQPISPTYLQVARWVRENTPPDAVFLADAELGPLLAVVGGRQLLRAESFPQSMNDDARRRQEERIRGGRRVARILEAARRYGVTHLVVNRAAREPIPPAGDYEGRPPFTRVYQHGSWLSIFRIDGGGGSGRLTP